MNETYTLTLKLAGNKTRTVKGVSGFRNVGGGEFRYFVKGTERSFTVTETSDIQDYDLTPEN